MPGRLRANPIATYSRYILSIVTPKIKPRKRACGANSVSQPRYAKLRLAGQVGRPVSVSLAERFDLDIEEDPR
jgi:hypothetical protein